MGKIVHYFKNEEFESISISFDAIDENLNGVGEKLNEINEEAYMNGYGWESLITFYLDQRFPELLEGLEPDPEAGMFACNYELNPENEKRGQKLAEILEIFLTDESALIQFVKKHGDQIEWDG